MDTDLLMEANHDRPLQDILIDWVTKGSVWRKSNPIQLDGEQQIISTGGSAVYSESAMSIWEVWGQESSLTYPWRMSSVELPILKEELPADPTGSDRAF